MKRLNLKKFLLIPLVLTMAVGACSPESEDNEMDMASSSQTETHSMDHDQQTDPVDMPDLPANTGFGTGEIRSIGDLKDSLTIAHGPIQGIGMSAMTMGFDIVGDVDLSPFSDGDKVAFIVKKGRDNSYRISEICLTETDGTDCLSIF